MTFRNEPGKLTDAHVFGKAMIIDPVRAAIDIFLISGFLESTHCRRQLKLALLEWKSNPLGRVKLRKAHMANHYDHTLFLSMPLQNIFTSRIVVNNGNRAMDSGKSKIVMFIIFGIRQIDL